MTRLWVVVLLAWRRVRQAMEWTGESIEAVMRPLLICGGLALIVLVLIGMRKGRYSELSICGQCGIKRFTTEWQVPNTQIRVFWLSEEQATPVSRTLMTNGIVPPHQHKWLGVHGSGNGVRCALGDGHLIIDSMTSPGVARLIETLQRNSELNFRDKVLINLFDPETSFSVRCLAGRIPDEGFADAAALHRWISEQSDEFGGDSALFKWK